MLYAVSDSRVTIWDIVYEENFANVRFSTSRKDKRNDTWVSSNFSFVRFVGDAFKKSQVLKEKDKITNLRFALQRETYVDKSGKTVYPQSPRIVVFDFDFVSAPSSEKEKPKEEFFEIGPSDVEEFPF